MYDVMVKSLQICVNLLKFSIIKPKIYSNFGSPNVDRLFLEIRSIYLPTLEKDVYEAVNNQ